MPYVVKVDPAAPGNLRANATGLREGSGASAASEHAGGLSQTVVCLCGLKEQRVQHTV